MSFHNAPVTKGVMISLGLGSLASSIFDVKHHFHLQLVPHISRHHQYWRLLTSQLVFGNSSDLLVAEVLLFNVAINIERTFGSRKYGSFLLISLGLSMFLLFTLLLLLYRTGINYLPPGPISLVFAILYQHYRIVPSAYYFRLSRLDVTDKAFQYFLALVLAVSSPPGTVMAAMIGLATGQLYRSDLVSLKTYRVPPSIERFCERFILPLVGSTRPPRRSNRALPELVGPSGVYVRDQTTAPSTGASSRGATPAPGSNSRVNGDLGTAAQPPSMMSQWVDELTGRRGTEGAHVPTDVEISTMMAVFPDLRREELVAALEQRGNVESAVEHILQRSVR